MNECTECHEELKDDIDQKELPQNKEMLGRPDGAPDREALLCPRCRTDLTFHGRKQFREQGLMFTDLDTFDVYACRECGHVELFLPGVGLKSHTQISTMVERT